MSFFGEIEEFLTGIWAGLKSWFTAETKAFEAAARTVEAEIERIGPAVFYAAVNAGLASIAGGGGLTGKAIAAAADVAIDTLLREGKAQVTGAVFTAIASALTELHANAPAGATPEPAAAA